MPGRGCMVHRRNKGIPGLAGLLALTLLASPAAAADPNRGPGIEQQIRQAIDAVYPALVQIYVLSLRHGGGRGRKFESTGSGVIISREGYVITNHHVAGKATSIRCVLSTREELDAELVGTDALADIAVIKLDMSSRDPASGPLPIARFGSSEALAVGEPVLAMGCPLAISQSVTRGVVSNKDMMIPKRMSAPLRLDGENVGSLVKWIGHDAGIFPGNSGGPLVNLRGEIVGINEIGLGLGGAIPSELAQPVSRELIESGRVRRSWVGAGFQPLLKNGTAAADQGALVSGVLPGSPSDRAGLRAGDILLSIDGDPVRVKFEEEMPGLIRRLLSKPVGAPMQVNVRRGREELSLNITPELRDDARGREVEAREWGVTLRRLTRLESKELRRASPEGVLVSSIRPGGAADKAVPRLRPGDVIVEIDGTAVKGVGAFNRLTGEICRDQQGPVPVVVAFDRRSERLLTLVEVGLRRPQRPPAEARKAWLPVATQVLSRKLARALDLRGKKGVRITQIYPGSSAEAAGFKVGDILTHVDSQLIEASEPQDAEVFKTMVRAYRVGSQAEFTVIRSGETSTVSAELVAMPTPEGELPVYEDLLFEFTARDISYLDRIANRWSDEESGALVSQVDAGGWAAVAGLKARDLIKAVDHREVRGVQDLEARLEAAGDSKPPNIPLFVKRGIYTLFLELQPNWSQGNGAARLDGAEP
ncbi:MAG: PDZ domain-containing protein [Acidobacteria bacterium]|nr:PDZ domain-containing protein [Acidobacteriota bacterium]